MSHGFPNQHNYSFQQARLFLSLQMNYQAPQKVPPSQRLISAQYTKTLATLGIQVTIKVQYQTTALLEAVKSKLRKVQKAGCRNQSLSGFSRKVVRPGIGSRVFQIA